MKHKNRSGKIGQRKPNEVLVQARIQTIESAVCVAAGHQPSEQSSETFWQVRWYQNTERLADLLQQGVTREQVNQVLWDEACREQDTIGVRIHSTMTLCTRCLFEAFQRHSGANPLHFAMMSTQVTGGAILVVSNRRTENAGIIAPFPADVEEKDILRKLRESGTFSINLKGE